MLSDSASSAKLEAFERREGPRTDLELESSFVVEEEVLGESLEVVGQRLVEGVVCDGLTPGGDLVEKDIFLVAVLGTMKKYERAVGDDDDAESEETRIKRRPLTFSSKNSRPRSTMA
jgi:hypothetical protein